MDEKADKARGGGQPSPRNRLAVAALLLLVGLVWIGQGTGLVAGSFMTGQAFWALVGVGCVFVAAVLAWPVTSPERPRWIDRRTFIDRIVRQADDASATELADLAPGTTDDKPIP